MNATIRIAAPLVAALAIAACSGGSSGLPGSGGTAATTGSNAGQLVWSLSHRVPQWQAKGQAHAACPQVVGKPTCLALVKSKGGISPMVAGWAPIDIETAYKLPIGQGAGQLVAIVDAFDNPNVASDLAAYRTEFGLGTANFTKYNETGQTSNYPPGDTGWGVEIDLDVEMVSAACPKCSIALIENNGNNSDFETAEQTAVNLGAHIVSNSWICYDSIDCGDPSLSNYFAAPGVQYLAASGDAGYNNNGAPEALANVVSVGGTDLHKTGSSYYETVWPDAGGGCSNNGSGAGVTKPAWQHDPSCSYRTDSDVSAVADDVAEYDSYGYGGWFTVGGTSVASPINAGVYGLAGNASTQTAGEKFWSESRNATRRHLNYVKSGNDGSCGGSYLCTAGTHQFHTYSGPGGWGTPERTGAY